jgi:hypothetical protein
VCLQEVQFERRADGVHELPGWLRLSGYEYVIPAQEQMAQMAARNARVLRSCTAIGNALLYRTDRLMDVDAKKPRADATTRVCMCLRGRPATALEPLGPLAVFSVHLDATKETTRVKQLSKCVEMAVDTFGTRAVLIAGDMNSELARGSCVAALVGGAHDGTVAAPTQAELQRECASALRLSTDDGAAEDDSDTRGDDAEAASPAEGGGGGSPMPTAEQMQAWQQLYDAAQRVPRAQRVRLERVPTGATRAAYAHGAMVGPCRESASLSASLVPVLPTDPVMAMTPAFSAARRAMPARSMACIMRKSDFWSTRAAPWSSPVSMLGTQFSSKAVG